MSNLRQFKSFGLSHWQKHVSERAVTAEDAVKRVRSGDRVYIHPGCAEPETLLGALMARREELSDVEIVHLMTIGTARYADEDMEGHFRHNAFFVGRNVREAVNSGRADYTPIFLSEIPALFYKGRMELDVALIQVSPPDEHGFCSFGVGVDITKAASETARTVVAQVNPRMPRTLGDSFIHVNKIDFFVEADVALPELAHREISSLHNEIGRHIAGLIEDGATLQMGIGGIPDAVLLYLREKRDLGIHTEMFSDGIVELVENGIITNDRKTLHQGKSVVTFVLGSEKLYKFIDNNPLFEFRPTEYANDPFVVSQNEKMVAINSAIQIDLTGQVVSDSIGASIYSGIGGQVDFIRGAARSKGGKPIIAIPSTAKDGSLSRIVDCIDPGAGVVTSRGDAHYVVTEYGVAYLHGKSLAERARSLINIAHPKFRRELEEAARTRKIFI
ncbi:MAG: 4-hydroxybutyrate CoA-transferase [Candidatus Latescibacteria bacterium]|nr:4-hydroxybutyrate CoA-transferase [Candidatus Latescibacterota bacterium]NIM21405.1 4-hydroxybutyrate CoA-transferase [Candidatus Latescibacterota bacterium]NIM65586.1 4-hydroxybutyrate CoA-transferase [Candidatus Latescibacterota bacterium]NIO01966.1 4-hydroxybutyrate CoA-transferase [Candidatus Latescibacterota bacterium]NIO28779.1 4-hydroxybutyrate CoA-transferase [Candidatus Latescibacterota bacterium]